MKQIILTVDYELFFGSDSWSVEECMLNPSGDLADILDINQSKMTVFWDILHFYKLLEMENTYSELKKDRLAIEKQIIELAQKGHDIQLHLHPHWLDARFIDGKWKFTYERFKLHDLSKTKDAGDVNTILGCVTISKNLMERIIRRVDKNYRVYAFRAGGYLVEPFRELSHALYENGIIIDSSVCPEAINDSHFVHYNFKNYPRENIYRFDTEISQINPEGKFFEIPITTLRVPLMRRIYFTLQKRLKTKKSDLIKKGTGTGSVYYENQGFVQKIISFIQDKKYQKFTTDSSFDEKYSYLLKKAKNNSTQILHPKMMNEPILNLLKSKVHQNEVKFISIKDFTTSRDGMQA